MSLNSTPSSERAHIGFFGIRNSGKSSIVNALTNQPVSLVSSHKGTTTDPVKKAMEILPIGPVVIIDTAGFDDEGDLGQLRKDRTYKILEEMDGVVLVLDARTNHLSQEETNFLQLVKDKGIPYIIVENHIDEQEPHSFPELSPEEKLLYVDATRDDMTALKKELAKVLADVKEPPLVSDLVKEKSTVVLVIPIDESAPKGRIILPQQMVLRDLLDHKCKAICCQPEELKEVLEEDNNISLVITDSQAFKQVAQVVPETTALTSFSILMARYKGGLETQLEGVAAMKSLSDGDTVLVAEACTHHRQCNDIGTVKIPGWIENYTGKSIQFEFSSGDDFPEDLSKYKLVVHCGGCMINATAMQNRVKQCKRQKVPIINYGMAIAEINGILDRSLSVIS